MLRLFVEWDGDAANQKLYVRCSSCGDIIATSDIAVAIYPVKVQSLQEVWGTPLTELDWTTVYTVHSGECAYKAKTLALETYKQVGAMQLSVFLSQLVTSSDGPPEIRSELWELMKQEMEWEE